MGAERLAVASAPLRIDFGGTVDIMAISLLQRSARPATTNIALDQRVTVHIHTGAPGRVTVRSALGPPEARSPCDGFRGRHGALRVLCQAFDMTGIEIELSSDGPPRSGLGGSAAVLVATAAALDTLQPLHVRPADPADLARLAYHVESTFLVCGLQDHASAAFGGANVWHWDPATPVLFARTDLVPPSALDDLSGNFCIAFTGETRDSTSTTSEWVDRALRGIDHEAWPPIMELTTRFIDAVQASDLPGAADAVATEMDLRRRYWPSSTTPTIDRFTAVAEEAGCGAKYAGAGGGGCVWAIGERRAVADLRSRWRDLCDEVGRGARLVPARLSGRGVEAVRAR